MIKSSRSMIEIISPGCISDRHVCGEAKWSLWLAERKLPKGLGLGWPTVAIRCAESGDLSLSHRRCATHRGWSDGSKRLGASE